MTTTPNPTAEQIVAEAISAYWADEERSGPNRAPEAHDRACGKAAADALRAHGLLSEGAICEEQAIDELANAIRLTVEYTGNEVLPAIEGWSWFDALVKYRPELAQPFMENPITPHSGSPSEEQIERAKKVLADEGFLPKDVYGKESYEGYWSDVVKEVLIVGGVAPQALDPEKVVEVLDDHEYMYSQYGCRCGWTGPGSHRAHQGDALCEAYTEGKLT